MQVNGADQVPVRRLAGIDLGIASEHTVRVLGHDHRPQGRADHQGRAVPGPGHHDPGRRHRPQARPPTQLPASPRRPAPPTPGGQSRQPARTQRSPMTSTTRRQCPDRYLPQPRPGRRPVRTPLPRPHRRLVAAIRPRPDHRRPGTGRPAPPISTPAAPSSGSPKTSSTSATGCTRPSIQATTTTISPGRRTATSPPHRPEQAQRPLPRDELDNSTPIGNQIRTFSLRQACPLRWPRPGPRRRPAGIQPAGRGCRRPNGSARRRVASRGTAPGIRFALGRRLGSPGPPWGIRRPVIWPSAPHATLRRPQRAIGPRH